MDDLNGETRGKIFAKSEYLLVEGQGSGSSFVMPKMAKLSADNGLLRLSRRGSVILAISVPLLLLVICLALFLQPSGHSAVFHSRKLSAASSSSSSSSLSSSSYRYAVIFDAGSSGSRVHVFRFDKDLQLVPIGDDLELYMQVKPGLSSYAKDPKAAAESLLPLLTKAENAVPEELRHSTPVKVGATAGLRLLEGDASEKILQAVRDLLKANSSLKYEADWVKVLDGSEEGSYMWVSINYLLGSLGKKFWDTVGVVDLGGGSVQMAYAISRRAAGEAPSGNVTYVKEMDLAGAKHYLYVHSYLNYGLLAARAEILKVKGSGNPCTLLGYKGSYTYGGVTYPASASASGSSMNKCRSIAIKALGVHESCPHMNCTFGGVWNGGGGPGQKNLFVASFFYDIASEAGFIDSNKTYAKVRPVDFKKAADRACSTTLKDAKSMYPNMAEDDLPYLCMDLTYEYTLLVDGFGLHPLKEVTLVQQIKYQKFLVGAAWPLGSAIDAVSSLTELVRTQVI